MICYYRNSRIFTSRFAFPVHKGSGSTVNEMADLQAVNPTHNNIHQGTPSWQGGQGGP